MEKKLLNPDEITDAVIEVGIKKTKRSNLQMLLLGILAGAFIGLGAYASNMVIHDMSGNYGLLKFVQGAVFVGAAYWLVFKQEVEVNDEKIVDSLTVETNA